MFLKRLNKKIDYSLDNISNGILPPLRNPYRLPASLDDFEAHHVKVLRRLNKHRIKEEFSGLMSIQVDIPNFIILVKKWGLVRETSYTEALPLLKMDELKSILYEHHIKVSGNKKDLIERILCSIAPQSIINSEHYSAFYLLTDLGQRFVDETYDKCIKKELAFHNKAISLILQYNLDEAYQLICKHNAELPYQTGMGIDWEKGYYMGMPARKKEFLSRYLSNTTDTFSAATAIYSFLSGFSSSQLYNIYNNNCRNELCKINSLYILHSYIDSQIQCYSFCATLDVQTCPICGDLDGKVFECKNAKIGVNLPPLHDGCRCTTLAVIENYVPTTRSMRNPITHKWERIPYITYPEWKLKYIKK